MKTKIKSGFTLTELIIYGLIFVVFMGFLSSAFWGAKKSLDGVQKMDDLQDLRTASININNVLSYGNRVLFPQVSNKVHNQILFKNNRNELIVIFIDEQQRLNLLNYEQFKSGKSSGAGIIARNALEFRVERPDVNLIKYSVRIADEKKNEHIIANAVKMRNTETNEPW